MLRKLRVLFFVMTMLTLFAGTASAYEAIFNTVTIDLEGQVTRFNTTALTVQELFEMENIEIFEKDKLNVSEDERISDGMRIEIVRGFYVRVNVDGIVEKVKVEQGTKVGNLITLLGQQEDMEYIYEDGVYSDDLYPEQMVQLKVKKTEVVITKEMIPFETQTVEDDSILEGEEVVSTEGKNGEKEISTEIVMIDGEEQSREVIGEVIRTEPVHKIIKKGTMKKQVVETTKGDFEYESVYNMVATAYTAGYESTGKRPGDKYYGITASGMRVRRGVVAVDPRVIPLGTELYVEGYGYAIAGDTGGAIKGKKIDLFMDSLYEARQFGRRTVTVYVLK